MTYALVNCTIFDGKRLLVGLAVIVETDQIKEIVEVDLLPKDIKRVDLNGALLAPGFIDLQVNGGGGVLFNDDISLEGLLEIAKAHQRYGTTALLPTLITTSFPKMQQAMLVVREAQQKYPQIIGLHLEGPYISQKRRGTHDPNFVREASWTEIEEIANNADVVKMITVAPECVSAEQVNYLVKKGLKVSLGHTDASNKAVKALEQAGATLYTHLYNAMSQLGSREVGAVGSALDSVESFAGIIVDGFHVDFSSVRIAKKCLGERLFLITDAMPPVGSIIREFTIGPLQVVCENGKCVNNEGALAGSALDMATAVRNMVFVVGESLVEALRMASLYPALALGIPNLGRIKKGYQASMVVLSSQLEVVKVVQNGMIVNY